MPNFSTVPRVQQTIRAGDYTEFVRGQNRVKINNAANCVPPLSPEDCKKLGLKLNVNWGELMVLLSHARRQYMTAFWGQENFFRVQLPQAPSDRQSEWESMITSEINKIMRKSLEYFEVHRSKWAAVVCHGIGPTIWPKRDHWLPRYLAIEDLRIPTDTTMDFRSLFWHAERHIYTPFELLNEAFNGQKKNKWDTKAVAQILSNYKQINYDFAPNHYDWMTTPEKLAELVKQDGGYFSGDAMPGIPMWHFFFQDNTDQDNQGLFMRIVPEQGTVRGTPENDAFLWTSDEPTYPKWNNRLHVQYGDLSNKAPFEYHSVRSLGYALLEPTFYSNLTRNRMLQHLNDNMDVWLRVSDPAEKARAQMQEFGNYKVIRPGVTVVGQQERHQVDAQMLEMVMAQLKQLQQEASSSYTQQIDNGTAKEQTAFETSVKLQQVNAMMGGLLQTAFIYESHSYREICRRFCLKRTSDPDILLFQKRMQEAKIPRSWLDVNLWDIEPVTPLGMGNPSMAQAEAQQLFSARGSYGPQAQQEILHECTLAWTGDARKASRWAPLNGAKGINDATRDAQLAFGTLMQGVPLQPKPGFNPIEQIEVLLPMMAAVIMRIDKRDSSATSDEIAGISSVAQYIYGLIQQLATDPEQQQKVAEYSKDMGNLMNDVKGIAQRGQEKAQAAAQAQAQQNGDGGVAAQVAALRATTEAKIQGIVEMAQAKIALAEKKAQSAQQMKDQEFVRGQRRKDAETFAGIQRDGVQTAVDAHRQMNQPQEGGEE